jgi:hypothetical protein
MILVDTSVLIDFFKGIENEPCNKFKTILTQQIPFGITPFVYQEILQGAKSQKEFNLLQKYLGSQTFFHPKDPIESFAKAAKIYFDCRRKGVTIRSTIDCIIAQTAIEHNLYLLHNDNDFNAMSDIIRLKMYT